MRISAKLAAVALAAALTAVAAPAYADFPGDPQPPVPHCDFKFKKLEAVNLWDDGDSDFIIFQAKGENYPGATRSIKFFLGTVQGPAAFDHPAGSATVIVRSFSLNVVLDEPFPRRNVDVPPLQQLLCGISEHGIDRTMTFTNGDAEYKLTYDLSLPHT